MAKKGNVTSRCSFEATVENYIRRHDLMRHDGFYIVALSGGSDSVALLWVLIRLGYHVEAAHCNFQLRGEESSRDELFCVQFCHKMNVTLHRIHFDTTTYAKLHQVSIEMAARELRYRYFEQLRKDIQADDICVAHHSDDQVETVLLNLIRGTGLQGLEGMKPRNQHVLRPLLCVSRTDIIRYLQETQQDFVTDSSNLKADVQRNQLRLNIIPQLQKINPAVKNNILRMTTHLSEVEKIVNQSLEGQKEAVCMPCSTTRTLAKRTLSHEDNIKFIIRLDILRQQPSPEYLLWHLLKNEDFNRQQILEMTIGLHSGSQWASATSVAIVDRNLLYVIKRKEWERALPAIRIPEEGNYIYTLGERNYQLSIKKIRISSSNFTPSHHPWEVTIDDTSVHFPLTLRPSRPNDRFTPFGMSGSRLVSDYLTDRKASLFEKKRQLVLTDGQGQILWLVGQRVAQQTAVTSSTTAILDIAFSEHEER